MEEGVERAQAEAEEDAAGQGAAFFSGFEDVGAGRALGELEVLMLVDDELLAQGDHEEDAEEAADEGEHEDAGVLEVETEEDEGREGEDDAGGDGLAGVAVVWTMMFSRIEDLPKARRMLMESTAMGMEAATVRPARQPT